jgi:thioredoxin 1
MNLYNTKRYIFLLALSLISFAACGKQETKPENKASAGNINSPNVNHKIEFIELGSVNCIPCKQMQPVMASIEKKYKGVVKVTFFDVWKDSAPAKKYGIDLIPTQVFLVAQGKELSRHQGFYAEDEIDKFLQSQGVNIPE